MKVKTQIIIKKIISYFILVCLVLTSIEAFSFIFFYFFNSRFTFSDPQKLLVTDEIIADAASIFDADLGWTCQYKTPYGERPMPEKYKKDMITAFGDSYTHCDQVNHNETWEYYLSKKLQGNVYNFGVGAYGTDQAFLRFRKVFPKIKTKIVILGLITENIKRVVNVYRPFYYLDTGVTLTKPRLFIENGRLKTLRNPIRKVEDLAKLKRLGFLENIGKDDYWYTDNNMPVLSFPFTGIFFNKHFWDEVFNGKADDIDPKRFRNLWGETKYVQLMFKIFESFADEAEAQDAIPIIMILPMKDQTLKQYNSGQNDAVKIIADFCYRNNIYCFNGIDALTNKADSNAAIDSYFNGHVSAAGNRIIAEGLYNFLEENNLLVKIDT